jgi:ACS family tartrate transporter-like MFS transporter
LINSIGGLGGFVGPTIMGVLLDVTGGYTGGLLALTGALIVEAALVLALRLPPSHRFVRQPQPSG